MSYKAKTAPWELTFWKKKIKPAAGRSDLCKQAANAAVTPEDSCHPAQFLDVSCASRNMECLHALQGEDSILGVDLLAEKIKPAVCSCDFYQQAAHAALQNREALSSCAVPWCQLCQSKDGADRFRNGRGLRREAIRDGAGFKMRFARNGGCCTRGLREHGPNDICTSRKMGCLHAPQGEEGHIVGTCCKSNRLCGFWKRGYVSHS